MQARNSKGESSVKGNASMKYSWLLNNMGLNLVDPLTHEFSSINTSTISDLWLGGCNAEGQLYALMYAHHFI